MRSSEPNREVRAPVVDLLENLALLVVPTLGFGFGVAVLGGTENLVTGLVTGGMVGAMLVGLRRGFYAVRTDDGIERRLKGVSDSPEDNPWVRLANIEYGEKYDPALAVVLGIVGLGALAAIPFSDGGIRTVVWLGMIGLFGITTSLWTCGLVLSR